MENGRFTKEERKYLDSLAAVERVCDTHIMYADGFKRKFIRRYHAGEKPSAIFASAGMPAQLIGYKRIERATWRWKEAERRGALDLAGTLHAAVLTA